MSTDGNIILVGLMGVGKTTVGKKLARRLGKSFIDTDHAIEARSGVSVNRIFDVEGEDGFRLRETQMLTEIKATKGQVIATGGGIVIQEANRALLKQSDVVLYLCSSPELLWSRLRHCKTRPLLQTANPKQVLRGLYKARDPLYREVADYVIEVSRSNAYKTTERITKLLNGHPKNRPR